MSKFIGVKMVEAVPMTAEEAIKNHYIVSAFSSENYDINIGKKYAIEKAKDQIWAGLGFVLQWAINGLKKK